MVLAKTCRKGKNINMSHGSGWDLRWHLLRMELKILFNISQALFYTKMVSKILYHFSCWKKVWHNYYRFCKSTKLEKMEMESIQRVLVAPKMKTEISNSYLTYHMSCTSRCFNFACSRFLGSEKTVTQLLHLATSFEAIRASNPSKSYYTKSPIATPATFWRENFLLKIDENHQNFRFYGRFEQKINPSARHDFFRLYGHSVILWPEKTEFGRFMVFIQLYGRPYNWKLTVHFHLLFALKQTKFQENNSVLWEARTNERCHSRNNCHCDGRLFVLQRPKPVYFCGKYWILEPII